MYCIPDIDEEADARGELSDLNPWTLESGGTLELT